MFLPFAFFATAAILVMMGVIADHLRKISKQLDELFKHE